MRYFVAIAAVLSLSPALAQERTGPVTSADGPPPRFEISSGVDYERGDFGTQSDIEKTTLPVTVGASMGRLRVSVQLPFVEVRAPANVIAPTGPLGLPILVDPTRPSTVEIRQGLGDVRVGAAYDLPVAGFSTSVRAGAKLPTASTAQGLGTGKDDYSAGLDVARPLGAVTPFAGLTYTLVGDPDRFDVRNSISGQAGAALRLGASTTAHVGYAYGQSMVDGGDDDQRLIGGLNTGVSRGLSLGVYGSGGLGKGAPDVGGGVTLGLRFGPKDRP